MLNEKWIFLIVGSAAGGVARYGASAAVHRWLGLSFPYGTFLVNVSGCFLIGWLHALAEGKGLLSTEARLFLMTGFCGAYTTFSTFMLETSVLVRQGERLSAGLNVLGGVLLGYGAFLAGFRLGKF